MKKITIIGTGYVGLVSGAGISDFGHQVTCVDILEEKISYLNQGEIPFYEPGLKDLIERNVQSGRLLFSTEIERMIKNSEIIFIAVGTPEAEDGSADLMAINSVADTIANNLNDYKVICTKSTVPIGTGEKIVKSIRSKTDQTFDYCSNPEFLREGSAVRDFLRPDRIVLGASSNNAIEVMKDIYRPLYINETPMLYTTIESAEMIKYASNSFLALKISYINEIANLCEAVNADVHTIARAMGIDGRISPKFLHAGPGFGGSCFPKDIKALASLAKMKKTPMHTIEGAIKANELQKKRMIDKLRFLLGGNFIGKHIAILGLTFKPETDDIRESPAISMTEAILKGGGKVSAYDPEGGTNFSKLFPDIIYEKSWEKAVSKSDGMVILTEWNEFRGIDANKIKTLMSAPVVLDTRNILNMHEFQNAGIIFDNVGRLPYKN
ncbi:MAG: UDP-glucose/GDP-mannose dehydrogenase family protein [Candidatus Marinimicrobia bacterium]|nr:UDP-glucose/GDP-mannose dehydrogenase family protein [Candidatus Neomarinimicrobiota bacterium]